jgi:hypothetical protein
VRGELAEQDLERDLALDLDVRGPVDGPHATDAYQRIEAPAPAHRRADALPGLGLVVPVLHGLRDL